MSSDPQLPRTTLLERLDVALATWITEHVAEDIEPGVEIRGWRWVPDETVRQRWIAGLLGIRGYSVLSEDVADVLAGRSKRYLPVHQEHNLIRGCRAALTGLEARVADHRPPDGWWLVSTFRALTQNLRRFLNNSVRRDVPWDALRGLEYPQPDALSELLDGFHHDAAYGDDPVHFQQLHPIRQAGRVAWRIARMAPFPDLNLPMALLGAGTLLMEAGYPPPILRAEDRARFERFVQGRNPTRVRLFAERVFEAIPHGKVTKA